jgi:hypothetical protein
MPPYPRKKDLPLENNLLTPVTGAAGQVASYTPFMLFVCQQRRLIESQKKENAKKIILSGYQSNNQTYDKATNEVQENNLTDSQKYHVLSNNFSLGVNFSNGWKELSAEKKETFTQAAGTERIRRRLQRIYAKSWVESAKQTRESNAITSTDVMLRLREMDQQSKNKKNQWVKFGSKNLKFSSTRKSKFLHKKKGSPKLKRKEVPKGPQKPKNPVSAFQFYTRDVRDSVREQNPGVNGAELGKIISNKWKEKNSSERSIYVEKQNEDKVRFTKELEVFLANHPELSEKYGKKKRKKTNADNEKPNNKLVKNLTNDTDTTTNGDTLLSEEANQNVETQASNSVDQFTKLKDNGSVRIANQDKILKASGNGTSIFLASTQTSLNSD